MLAILLRPGLGFHAAESAETQFTIDENIDETALGGVGGVEAFVVFGGELVESFGRFVEDDVGFGEDAVLKGVEAGFGFALGGAGSGGVLGVGAAGRGLFFGW